MLCQVMFASLGASADVRPPFRFLFILSVPLGMIFLVGLRVRNTIKRNKVEFVQPEGAGSVKVFLAKVGAAPRDYKEAVHPASSYAIIKTIFGIIGAVCIIFGMSAAVAEEFGTAGMYFAIGIVLCFLSAFFFKKRPGRKMMCKMTNLFGGCVGLEYSIDYRTNVITCEEIGKNRMYMLPIVSVYAWVMAKFLALTKKEDVELLTNRGEWVTPKDGEDNKDTFSMFYSEFSKFGAMFFCFAMFKNIVVGLFLLTDQPKLIPKTGRVWIVALLYLAELIAYLFFPLTNDAVLGYKFAFQQAQQTMIIFVAALTASQAISSTAGGDFMITFAVIQVFRRVHTLVPDLV